MSHLRLCFTASCLALACAAAGAQSTARPQTPATAREAGATKPMETLGLQLRPGQEHTLSLGQRLTRVSLGNDKVLDALPLASKNGDDQLLLRAVGVGQSTLLVWVAGRPQPLRYEVQVSQGFASLTLDGQQGVKTLTGTSTDLQEHQSAKASAQRSVGQDNVVDRSTVALPSMVQVRVKLVEFSKKDLKTLGVDFSGNTSYGSRTLGIDSAFSPANALFAFNVWGPRSATITLKAMEDQGLVRVLSEPTLVAMSGQMASFLAGGEIPIPVPNGSTGGVTIEYRSFGIGLKVTPTVVARNRIVLKVAPEASDLDFENALRLSGTVVPAITTRRADTMVELAEGETFAIGGLISRTTSSSVKKVPFLGDLPVLGAFFKSLEFNENERELLMLVTPYFARPSPRDSETPALPGEQRAQPGRVWSDHFLGRHVSDHSLPGFSR